MNASKISESESDTPELFSSLRVFVVGMLLEVIFGGAAACQIDYVSASRCIDKEANNSHSGGGGSLTVDSSSIIFPLNTLWEQNQEPVQGATLLPPSGGGGNSTSGANIQWVAPCVFYTLQCPFQK